MCYNIWSFTVLGRQGGQTFLLALYSEIIVVESKLNIFEDLQATLFHSL